METAKTKSARKAKPVKLKVAWVSMPFDPKMRDAVRREARIEGRTFRGLVVFLLNEWLGERKRAG